MRFIRPGQITAIASLALLVGCSTIEAPDALSVDLQELNAGKPTFALDLRLGPTRAVYAPQKTAVAASTASVLSSSWSGRFSPAVQGRPALGFYEPELRDSELLRLDGETVQSLVSCCRGPFGEPALLSSDESDAAVSIAEQCRQAENTGAKFLVLAEVLENRISYMGPRGVAWAWDVFCLLMFTPFHIYVADEVFEARRTIGCRIYDVRDPVDPVKEFAVTGRVVSPLHELEHGYVFLHPVRRFWSDWQIFAPEDWQRVYDFMMPSAQRALMRELLSRLQNKIGPILEDYRGLSDPSKSRLYAVVAGHGGPGLKYAVNDAKAIAAGLRSSGVVTADENQQLLTDRPAGEILEAIRRLKTRVRPVDRVLIYFSGLGRRASGAAELICGDTTLKLADLARACDELAAGSVLYLLETSFGDAVRGKGKGGRTAGDSESNAKPIGDALIRETGRQLLLAAPPDQVTGEYKGHGLLTGFLLDGLKPGRSDLSINQLVQDAVLDRFSRRSRGLLGVSGDVYRRFHGDIERDFLLRRQPIEASPAEEK